MRENIDVHQTKRRYDLGEDFEKGMKKMEEHIRAKATCLRVSALGLSIRVEGMKGPIVEGELAKCNDFVKQLTAQPSTS